MEEQPPRRESRPDEQKPDTRPSWHGSSGNGPRCPYSFGCHEGKSGGAWAKGMLTYRGISPRLPAKAIVGATRRDGRGEVSRGHSSQRDQRRGTPPSSRTGRRAESSNARSSVPENSKGQRQSKTALRRRRKANPRSAAPRSKDGKGVTRTVALAESQDPRRPTPEHVPWRRVVDDCEPARSVAQRVNERPLNR
jgi:hypothetical protein